MSYVFAYIKPR